MSVGERDWSRSSLDRRVLGLAATLGGWAGLGGALGMECHHAAGLCVHAAGAYAAIVIGAFAGVGCLELSRSQAGAAGTAEARLGLHLLSGVLSVGLLAMGLGGWLSWRLPAGEAPGMMATSVFAVGTGVLVSSGGILGLWIALKDAGGGQSELASPLLCPQ